MRRWRDSCGQAANEYVALLAIVAVVVISAVGLTTGGIGSQLVAGMQLGLCRVAGTTCPRPAPLRADLPACPLERQVREEKLSETIASVKLGTKGTLTVVRHSDGRVTVTLADGSSAGAELAVGAGFRLGGLDLTAEARTGAEAVWSAGRSWTFPSVAAAERFVARYGDKATTKGKLLDGVRSRCSILCDAIGWNPHPELPTPDETFSDGGSIGKLAVALGLGAGKASGALEEGELLGERVARDGSRTWYLRTSDELAGRLVAARGELALAGKGATVISYRTDSQGRPLTLGLARVAETSAGGSLALDRTSAAGRRGRGGGALATGDVVELDVTLDLADADNRSAAAGLLELLRDRSLLVSDPGRLALLAERISRHGQVDARVYELDSETWSAGGSLALGLKVGGSLDRTNRGMRLVDAATRLPGLPFLARHDCLAGDGA